MAEKVLTLLTGLYYMYRNSPLNRTNLKNAFRYLSINIKLPTRAGGTRWVGHLLLSSVGHSVSAECGPNLQALCTVFISKHDRYWNWLHDIQSFEK